MAKQKDKIQDKKAWRNVEPTSVNTLFVPIVLKKAAGSKNAQKSPAKGTSHKRIYAGYRKYPAVFPLVTESDLPIL
ncbi:MAG: hypothetical protein ACRCUT_08770, partial [Spirochaetota bacterium]